MRKWLFLLICVIVSAAVTTAFYARNAVSANKPNIIFILADDLGVGDLSAYNPESKISTPNLDRLALSGRKFTDALAPSSVCTPSRYMLLTGRYSWRTRLKESVLWSWDDPLIDEGTLTLPELMKSGGYDTAMIGKWHLGWDWPTKDDAEPIGKGKIVPPKNSGSNVDFNARIKGGPIDHGFDTYFGVDVPNFPPYAWIQDDRLLEIPTLTKPSKMYGANGPMTEGWSLAAIEPTLSKKAVEYIRGRTSHKKPFFLYYSLTVPHTPIDPSADWSGTSRAGQYGDFVQQMDDSIGQLLAALEQSGQLENTAVIFTADNGSAGFSNNSSRSQSALLNEFEHKTSLDFKGYKLSVFEGGFRVPLIMSWPGMVEPNSTSDAPVYLIDWMRTLARVADFKPPKNAAPDSFDMLPELIGAPRIHQQRESAILSSYNGSFVLRRGKHKLVAGSGPGFGADKDSSADQYYLYDVISDHSEETDLTNQDPGLSQELIDLLEKTKASEKSVK